VTYLAKASEHSRFVLDRRGKKNAVDPLRAYGAFVEEEADGSGGFATIATLLLTNRECPWKCVFCDLWKNTLDTDVPRAAIETQIRRALADLPPARWIKLYNAGSFFDPRAIPSGEVPAVAQLLAPFERVIVESHPAFVDERVLRLRDRIPGRLEVAIGLEVANAAVLARLNKGMTLADFARAAEYLRRERIDLRAFVMVQPPFVAPEEAVERARRSLEFAQECGARVCTLLPTRGGNGALEALAEQGHFAPPSLATFEAAFERGLPDARSLVFADLWDLERFAECSECFPARRDRLARMNRTQKIEPPVVCAACAACAGAAG
jgi:radical SAM enzyme (TIGR01210 family)